MTKNVCVVVAIAAFLSSCTNVEKAENPAPQNSAPSTARVEQPQNTHHDFAYEYLDPHIDVDVESEDDKNTVPLPAEVFDETAIIKTEDVIEEPTTPPAPSNAYEALKKYFEPVAEPMQVFVLAGDSATIVNGRRGARIHFDPNKLQTFDGKPYTGPVTLELMELQTPVDMLFANTPTASNGDFLETGGSYYINCKTNRGQSLQIKPDQDFKLEVPAVGKDSMDLYAGTKQPDGSVNWNLTPTPVKTVRKPAYYITLDYYKKADRRYWYDKGTKEVVVERKLFDDGEFKEISRFKPRAMHRMAIKRYMRKIMPRTYSEFIYDKSVRIDSALEYKQLSNARLFGRYRSKGKQISGIRPVVDPNIMTINRRNINIATSLHQIDNRPGMVNTYFTTVTGFGWINCDRLFEAGPRTDVIVELPKSESKNKFMAFLVFKNVRGIMEGYVSKSGNIEFTKIPTNQDAIMVVINEKDNKLMASINDVKITTLLRYKPVLSDVTADVLKNTLASNLN